MALLKKETTISAILVIGVFYFAFMILDRGLSLVYGFNFQPYGTHMPPAFTFWGHIINASAVSLGLYLTFTVYDYGKRKGSLFLKILPLTIYFTIGAVIPYINDASHLEKNNMIHTLPIYIIANDLYLFLFGLVVFRVATSVRLRAMLLVAMLVLFLVIHFLFYTPAFPEFYWS